RIGKHRVSVTQSIRLLSACPAVQSAVSAGAVTAGHARALVALDTVTGQEHGLKVVLARRLSVRQTENWVRAYRPRRAARGESAELRALASDMEKTLGLPVRMKGTANRGRLEIRYSSREELGRVCAKLLTTYSHCGRACNARRRTLDRRFDPPRVVRGGRAGGHPLFRHQLRRADRARRRPVDVRDARQQ